MVFCQGGGGGELIQNVKCESLKDKDIVFLISGEVCSSTMCKSLSSSFGLKKKKKVFDNSTFRSVCSDHL